MKLNQKVRVLRRFGNHLIDEHEHHSWEITAFGAPSEVWDIIGKATHERVGQLMSQLDITAEEFDDEINRQIQLEAKYSGNETEPPMAYYESIMISDHL